MDTGWDTSNDQVTSLGWVWLGFELTLSHHFGHFSVRLSLQYVNAIDGVNKTIPMTIEREKPRLHNNVENRVHIH